MTEPLSIVFITRTRDDLVRLSLTLAANIKPEALKDACAPLIWSNHGSYNAGKSLIAETAASRLAGTDIRGYFESEAGMLGFDSEFHSYRDDQGRQFQFCDIYFPWSGGLFSQRAKQQRKIVPKIIDGQTSGGIVFIHNAPQAARDNGAAIEMRILERRRFNHFFNDNARKMPAFSAKSIRATGLKADYNRAKASGERSWIRLVDLTVYKPDIFLEGFADSLKNIDAIKVLLSESPSESCLSVISPP